MPRTRLLMNITTEHCCVLNGGNGAWAFETLATQLSSAIGIGMSATPGKFNYLLHMEGIDFGTDVVSFIPLESVKIASDKRLLADTFRKHGVPTPETHLFENFEEAARFVASQNSREWCLKFPTSCGANGHRFITQETQLPDNWPTPLIVQEFIRMENPEVYRTYCAGGELFGWVARRFPEGKTPSPWVAHARGARYVRLEGPPTSAMETAEAALRAAGLWDSFGCVDLLRTPDGRWVALEVGTDGIANHVDRELDNPELEAEIQQRIADAFWKAAGRLPM